MQRSGSQKFLLVVSILNIVFNGLAIIATIALGTFAASQDITGGAVGIAAYFVIVTSVLSMLEGILGLRAANDASKIMPVWILAIIGLVASVAACILSLVNGTFGDNVTNLISSLVGSGLMFWIANNIKQQAGK